MDKQTIDTYNKLAAAYDQETTVFWDLFPSTFIDAFAAACGPKVLDVGCGPGRDGALLLQAGKEVTGVDGSETMVAMSNERGLDAIQADIAELPFPDASFDGVWSYTTLLHVPKDEVDMPLAEIHRVLEPGGAFALGMIEGDTEEYRTSSGMDQLRWFSYYQRDELVERVEKHGFKLVHEETFKPGSRRYFNLLFTRN
jgi:ubiquinone/menaquinone biosynthesis C-methylase UbiE